MRTDRQPGMTRLTDSFRNFAVAPKMKRCALVFHRVFTFPLKVFVCVCVCVCECVCVCVCGVCVCGVCVWCVFGVMCVCVFV
jgi:hypothetical protein